MNQFPQVKVVLTVPIMGSSADKDRQAHGSSTISIEIRVRKITLVRNDHLQADECHMSAEWTDANVDPRFLKHATVQVWMGAASDSGYWEPSRENFRFIGICTKAHRKTVEGGLAVDLEFRDYTSMFLAQKPYPTSGHPSYQMSLRDTWRLVCDSTGYYDVDQGRIVSNVAALRDRIVFRGGVNGDMLLSEGVPARLAKYGKLSLKSGDSAWDAWQRAVFSLGLVSWIDKDQCIVTTTTELFSERTAPALIYGLNILDMDEEVDTSFSNKGIHCTSYDVTTGKTIEAFYPPPGDPRIHVKRSVAKRKDYNPDDVQSDQYEVYEIQEVSNQKALENIAHRAYDEMSRQEIQGMVVTGEMKVENPAGEPVDLLDLGAGDCISIQIEPENLELLKNKFGDSTLRELYLVNHGYDENAAAILSRNLDAISSLSSVYHTKSVATSIDSDSNEVRVTIHYHNRILYNGNTDDRE